MDKFIVKSNITSNKLQNFETVSRGSRHRSNHTQKNFPSVVAGHQFLQFSCIGPDNGVFPITSDTSRLLLENKSEDSFSQNCFFRICCLPLATSKLCAFEALHIPKDFPRHHPTPMLLAKQKVHNFHFSARVLQLTIISGKSDITKVAGSFTAPNRFRILV